MKYYKTNPYRSTAFYFAIFLPFLVIFITILLFSNIKEYWPALLFFYCFVIPLEILAIKYRHTSITIDDEGIIIKTSNLVYNAKWDDIIQLQELLYTPSGETTYVIKTKDKKTLTFGSSIQNYGDLLKEIEQHTSLKLKQRL